MSTWIFAKLTKVQTTPLGRVGGIDLHCSKLCPITRLKRLSRSVDCLVFFSSSSLRFCNTKLFPLQNIVLSNILLDSLHYGAVTSESYGWWTRSSLLWVWWSYRQLCPPRKTARSSYKIFNLVGGYVSSPKYARRLCGGRNYNRCPPWDYNLLVA